MQNNRIRIVLLTLILSALSLAASNDGSTLQKAPLAPHLDMIKKLEGEWVTLDDQGQPTDTVASIFKVTAGGSAVLETLNPGTPYEMLTLYYMDGEKLALTHYCVLGNQPRMVAKATEKENTLKFEFAGGCNIDESKDQHMHEAVIEFLNKDRYKASWTMFSNGVNTQTAVFDVVRKKQKTTL